MRGGDRYNSLKMLSSFAGELKSQGVAEASRDPSTNVSAEDAERVMVEESKKAGATTFEFDPNASTEEKAAQARAVSSTPMPFTNSHVQC